MSASCIVSKSDPRNAMLRPLTAALVAAALAVASDAQAEECVIHAEGAASIWVDGPQSDRFTPGVYAALRPGISFGRVVSLQWSYAVLHTAAKDPYTEAGTAQFVTAGLRLRPFGGMQPAEKQLGGLFIDGNIGYVRTGDLDRVGVDAGLGYNIQATDWLALGPVVRYGQIIQPNHLEGRDPNDGQFVTLGLNLSLGTYHKPVEPTCPDPVACPALVEAMPVQPELRPCLDTDGDGTCDADDRCLNQPGSTKTWGCPVDPCTGPPLLVRVQFPFDSTALPEPHDDSPQTMDPILDAVARSIAQDPSCRVCIVGYASEEGSVGHNQTLSAGRASAVQKYMSARGIAASRLPTTAFGEQCQLQPEATLPQNRRVEFRRLLDGESCPSTCSTPAPK